MPYVIKCRCGASVKAHYLAEDQTQANANFRDTTNNLDQARIFETIDEALPEMLKDHDLIGANPVLLPVKITETTKTSSRKFDPLGDTYLLDGGLGLGFVCDRVNQQNRLARYSLGYTYDIDKAKAFKTQAEAFSYVHQEWNRNIPPTFIGNSQLKFLPISEGGIPVVTRTVTLINLDRERTLNEWKELGVMTKVSTTTDGWLEALGLYGDSFTISRVNKDAQGRPRLVINS